MIWIILLAVVLAVVILFESQANLKRRLKAVEDELRALSAERLARARKAENPEPASERQAKPVSTQPPPIPPKPAPDPKKEPVPTANKDIPAPKPTEPTPAKPKETPVPEPLFKKPSPIPTRTTSPERVTKAPPPPPKPPEPTWFDNLIPRLRDNWFYVISAISLGLAGIFLVQYSIEKGLLPPAVRIVLSMIFGATLIAAGDYIRRRWGDDESSSTAFLPSTFSAAGIVVLYASILAARGLHGLIGPEIAFAGLAVVSAIAMTLGWFYGPFLAAAGLTGAAVAPFLVGGNSDSGYIFYFYYGILAATALAIDALRRWGWVSSLGLGLSYMFGLIVLGYGAEYDGYAALMTWLAFAAIALPRLELIPTHPGPSLAASLMGTAQHDKTPILPSWIAAGAVSASTLFLFATALSRGADAQYLVPALLAILTLALIVWAYKARGLEGLALIPAAAFLLQIISQKFNHALFEAELVIVFVDFAMIITLAAFWRSLRDQHRYLWALGAILFAPISALLLDLFWAPAAVLGAYLWAWVIIAIAGLMVFFAHRYARVDRGDMRRAAWATLSALSLIALALFTLLSNEALTVALTVLIAVAAWLDRRFDLFEMGWFILAGTATLGWRLLVSPGLKNYISTVPVVDVLLAFGAVLIGLTVARHLITPRKRTETNAILESATWAYGGVFASILIWRWIESVVGPQTEITYWSAALLGLNWAVLGLAQIYRLPHSTGLRLLRLGLALGYTALAALTIVASATVLNPAINVMDAIYGVRPFDTLLVAYAIPGLILLAAARFLQLSAPSEAPFLGNKRFYAWPGGVLIALYIVLEIRSFWHGGPVSAELGFLKPELYSYTVVLAAMMALFAYLDRRLRLPEMQPLIMTGAAIFGIRLFILPGLAAYTSRAGLGEVLFAFATAFVGVGAAMVLAKPKDKSRTILETILWTYGGTLVGILAWRFADWALPLTRPSYFAAAIIGMAWMLWCVPQALRLRDNMAERDIRILPIAAFRGLATLCFLIAPTLLNPIFGPGGEIRGIAMFDTLLVAYVLPALAAIGIGLRVTQLPWQPWRLGLVTYGGLSLVMWVFLEIRKFWRGDVPLNLGTSQPELYTYTVALLMIGGGLLYLAITKQSQLLRRVAMGVIALTVAKVFFVDAGGLTGLLRVFSFLALGLVLAGLAWLNRWAADQAPEEDSAS